MKLPSPIYSALFAVAALAAALAPAPAAAVMPTTTTGGCQLIAEGVYYDFAAKQFCEGVGAAAGGGPPEGSGRGGGGAIPEQSGEVIFVHDSSEESKYCGSLTDDFAKRRRDCYTPSTICSAINGCVTCSADGCIAGGRTQGSSRHTQRAKPRTRKLSRAEVRKKCRGYMADTLTISREYKDVLSVLLRFNFTWDEIMGEGISVWVNDSPGPTYGAVGIKTETRPLFWISGSVLPDGFWKRAEKWVLESARVTELSNAQSCGQFDDVHLPAEDDVFNPERVRSRP